MGRPKGSKNKIKKVVDRHPTKDKIKAIKAQKKKPKKMPKHVLLLEPPFYITCDAHTFILKQAVDKKDKDGKKIADVCLLYSPYLDTMLQVAANYMVRVPADVEELGDKLQHIYEMIMDRTSHKRPKDMFKEFANEEEILEELS